MIDFLRIATRSTRRGVVEIYPKFVIRNPSDDLMIRGGDFYAVWVEERGLWSTNEQDAINLIDSELKAYADEYRKTSESEIHVLYMWDASSGMIDLWHKYVQRQMRDSYHMLDERLIFQDTKTTKTDYASKKLPYPKDTGEPEAWNKLLSTLYSPEERTKIEWAIGSIVSGDSRKNQKFMVFYGAAGTGKSTVINVIQQLFEGYTSVFDAKALGSSSNSFALEAFRKNPLVAIQHDGDLSRIEDNTRLNSLVSHEAMTVNEKFRSAYENRFKAFLFMGTNKPVKITDARSGLIRRLIDVSPTGNKLPPKEYKALVKQVGFELGKIATRCEDIYNEDPGRYDDYIPLGMMSASNDFYNFVLDSWQVFKQNDETTLKAAWEMYKAYCEDAKVPYPYPQRLFKEELKNYFREFYERESRPDGTRIRNHYVGFIKDKFESDIQEVEKVEKPPDELPDWLRLRAGESAFDKLFAKCPAQYATENERPLNKWDNVKTQLRDLDTSRLHYVRTPESYVHIDFDLKGPNGEKSLALNLEAARKWPPTYAEVSKGGQGLHLTYMYKGDTATLSCIYDDNIEIKVCRGLSSLRRRLSLCNDLEIASISSGLPLKGEGKTLNFDAVLSERAIRTLIKRNLNKEYHGATKPSVDFIFKILEDQYKAGTHYDVSDLQTAVLSFAAGSTHQAEACVKLVGKMHFKSDEPSEPGEDAGDSSLVFFDTEVFPNLFLVNYKMQGDGKPVVRLVNPKPSDIETLVRHRLVGFNCRKYDNHMLYGCMLGYSNKQLYELSGKLIANEKSAQFGEAFNLSYTDVYDFSSKKQSLKKFEIELGIHHQELGLPWDQPVPENLWPKVAEYCDNDVIATERVFEARKADFEARQALVRIINALYDGKVRATVNDTTNSLSAKVIFGANKSPQNEFVYTDLSTLFPGYKYEYGKSSYRDVEEVGEGGRVWSKPGMYFHVKTFDVASMHPHSIKALNLFGDRYTRQFYSLVEARVAVKHRDFDKLKTLFNGVLYTMVQGMSKEELDNLCLALKIVINSVYGMTSAKFPNIFKDPRNVDNIVAKRGALFMIDLQHAVQERGGEVVHIKTDSIKVANPTPDIEQFILDYGQKWGYSFEVESIYKRFCLVNDAVYIAYEQGEGDKGDHWTATGTQFQVPYVFKTLFTHEAIAFDDLCETKEVTSSLYLDFNETLPDVTLLEKELDNRKKGKLGKNYADISDDELKKRISEGHDYRFIGKVGQFSPVKAGVGGGILCRASTGKEGEIVYNAATGTKGYRWLESETLRKAGDISVIEQSYYRRMVDEARDTISKFGDFEHFATIDKGESA